MSGPTNPNNRTKPTVIETPQTILFLVPDAMRKYTTASWFIKLQKFSLLFRARPEYPHFHNGRFAAKIERFP
jgi:hypothetical protein